ncbi:MAG: hypothetical protein Q9218_003177 [Villophora microphyllina]
MPVTGFELFGLIGSIKATADIIDNAVRALKDYHNSDDDIRRLCFALKADSVPLRRFVKVLSDISTAAEGLEISEEDEELHKAIATHLASLEARFREKVAKLSVDDGGRLASRSAGALWRKRDLEKLEKELGDWIRRAWVIYAAIDAEIKTSITTSGRNLSERRMADLVNLFDRLSARPVKSEELLKPFNALKAQGEPARRFAVISTTQPAAGTRLIFEYMYKPYSDNLTADEIDLIGSATRDLASVLYHSNPEQTRILKSPGYCHDSSTRRFGLIYELPSSKTWAVSSAGHARVLSLRELLNRVPHCPLNHKLRFCCNIAQAMLYVHLVGWVHKSIRPDNILVFEDEAIAAKEAEGADSQYQRSFPYHLSSPYLAGFEYARSVKALSDRTSDAEWRVNIYRHPKRQHLVQNEEYTMAHDIYSLGVVFLELGLWGSNGFIPFQKREAIFKGAPADDVKDELLVMCRGTKKADGVAVFMGKRFADLIEYCLHIDEKQEVPTAAFIREVWLKLDEISSAL